MAEYLVELKRVVYSTAVVEANSAAEAKRLVNEAGAHEYMLLANILGTDTTTIVSVKPR